VRIEILGSAAGGGFPQWNCNCRNCYALRAGTFRGKARTQTQVAVSNSSNGTSWILLNASPDLRLQIEATPRLHPSPGSSGNKNVRRGSRISSVLLTSGDIDQIAGLLSLRELQSFRIYCTASLRRILQDDNSVFAMLNRVPDQVSWKDIGVSDNFSFSAAGDEELGLSCTVFSLGWRYPPYVSQPRAAQVIPEEASLGVMIESDSGGRLAYMPAVPAIDRSLVERLESADLVLFDGTFWSDDELIQVQSSGARAREMGHVPVSGADGSLRALAGLKRPRKIFIHVNNTNPMLDEAGPEHRAVGEAGWEIAEDGWNLEL
jgi:pyrroloquinoline quinone biosynthesis protein B